MQTLCYKIEQLKFEITKLAVEVHIATKEVDHLAHQFRWAARELRASQECEGFVLNTEEFVNSRPCNHLLDDTRWKVGEFQTALSGLVKDLSSMKEVMDEISPPKTVRKDGDE